MNVSSVKNLNGEVFSAVQDASLTNVVQSNSANWANETISSYTTATIESVNAINSLNGKPIISFRTQSAQEAGVADKARYDFNGNNLADDHNSLTALNNVVQSNSAQWAELPTYEYDNTNKISAINGSAIAAGDEFPASANEAITAYQNASATYLTAHQPISAEEWNDCYDNVNTNSGAWGGSALPISAGPGINLYMVNGVLVISLA
jgi:hypothetical protein